jgi:nitroimidazol reductase NimA-like FMN-containing flavoprotein (pyridoxamine 5'-phosphate oxidase superfamily)
MLKKIQTLVKSRLHLVLATAGQMGPHASLMAFAAAADASEFWLATAKNTRKFENLQTDPRASLLIDDSATPGGPRFAVVVAARLAPFATPADEAEARRELLARHPDLAGLLAGEAGSLLRLVVLRRQLFEGLDETTLPEAEKKS